MSPPATHRAFGLTWHVPFDFPAFNTVDADGSDAPADVEVVEAEVPPVSAQAQWAGPLRAVENRCVTYGMPDAARMLISDGDRIAFQRHPGGSDEAFRLALMGPASALVLHQRGALPLHGSGIVTERGAILILGHSGAGKSTTLGAFMDRGYAVLCDDLAAVALTAEGRAVVFPGTRVLKVWADSAASLGWRTDGLPRVRTELEKYLVPLSGQSPDPVPIAAIYQLSTHNGREVQMRPRERAAKFNALLDHTWQKMTVKRMGLHMEHFQHVVAIANQVPVIQVLRPDGVPIDRSDLVERIEADFTS